MATKEEHYWNLIHSDDPIRPTNKAIAEALAERDAAREELKGKALEVEDVLRRLAEAHAELGMRSYAPPAAESAPVVGGVTEDLIDAICDSIQPPHRALGLLVQLRKEIRATKRVDVEAIREVARSTSVATWAEQKILRAIGDEPAAEAPAPFSIPSTGGESVQWAEAPSPEPAAPEETPPGVRFAILGQHIVEHRGGYWPSVAHCIDPTTARMIVGKLNEAEKLGARVAELEEQLGTRDTDRIWRSLHNPYDAIERECAKQKARADAAEAKLAALGENPIQRELVERHRHVSLFRRTVETLDSILAGRGPEVAS